MSSSRLPYPWKVVVAAAVIALLIVGLIEIRRRWPPSVPVAVPPSADSVPSGLYEDTLHRVQEIIAVHTSSLPEVVTAEMRLVDLGVDPLTRVDIAEALESAYKIKLSSAELAQTATVDDLVRLVVKQQQTGPASAKLP